MEVNAKQAQTLPTCSDPSDAAQSLDPPHVRSEAKTLNVVGALTNIYILSIVQYPEGAAYILNSWVVPIPAVVAHSQINL